MNDTVLALQIQKEAFQLMEKQFTKAVAKILEQARTIRKLESQLKELNNEQN
jgi:hypothetical protein